MDAGPPSDEVFDVEGGDLFALFRFDNLDSAFFPTRGVRGSAKWLGSRAYLGADNEFDQAQLDLTGAATFGSHTLILGARYFTTFKGTVPLQNRFRMGGMFELPGFVENELSGQDLYLLRTIYQRKLANLFNTSPYLGLSVQYGQVFESDEDISLSEGIVAGAAWLGWESFFGPIYAGYGRADTGNQSLYLILGRPFLIKILSNENQRNRKQYPFYDAAIGIAGNSPSEDHADRPGRQEQPAQVGTWKSKAVNRADRRWRTRPSAQLFLPENTY